jgi:hypothetical protein
MTALPAAQGSYMRVDRRVLALTHAVMHWAKARGLVGVDEGRTVTLHGHLLSRRGFSLETRSE